jgi:ribosomal protein S17
MRIEKKSWPETFEKIMSGEKTFDLRLADWECKPGDVLVLKEWDPKTKKYTGRSVEKTVNYVLKTKEFKCFSQKEVDQFGYQVIALK